LVVVEGIGLRFVAGLVQGVDDVDEGVGVGGNHVEGESRFLDPSLNLAGLDQAQRLDFVDQRGHHHVCPRLLKQRGIREVVQERALPESNRTGVIKLGRGRFSGIFLRLDPFVRSRGGQ